MHAPHRTSIPSGSNPPFPASALLRRFSTPSPYTGDSAVARPLAAQPTVDPTTQMQDQIPFHPIAPADTVHNYIVKSRGRAYALIGITSHALNVQDPPLFYFGEELKGSVILSLDDLNDMRNMDVMLQMFNSSPIVPSYETKCVLSSQQVVEQSHISGGRLCWSFVFAFPTVTVPSSSSSAAGSSHSSNVHSTSGDPKFQLVVTFYRRGRLTRNVGMAQKISYVPPPPLTLRSSPLHISVDLPHEPPTPTPSSSWPQQKLPAVLVTGLMFDQVPVEVECKLIAPSRHEPSNIIPLKLVLTSESRQALELFAVSRAIDVRLQKVMAFGERASAIQPLNLMDRSSFHRTDWAAIAHWEDDSQIKELTLNERHPKPRWRVKINGELRREPDVELSPSFDVPGMSLMYFVCFFPFRAIDFRPATNPKKVLVMGKIRLTTQ
ncbi:hypothetical protein BJV74DRAFT_883111 [Russula compacta]|nr:hypothetical protein BJV74DRAFT_883111 [Russula compacta]